MNIEANKRGWITETISFRRAYLVELIEENKKALSSSLTIYQAIQPVGLINGQLFGKVTYPHSQQWSAYDRTKVLFADCLVSSALLSFDEKRMKDEAAIEQAITQVVINIGLFYKTVCPEINVSYSTIFGKRKKPNDIVEAIAEKRAMIAIDPKYKLIEQFFHNGLLFLDIYIFSRWNNTLKDEVASLLFRSILEDMRFSVIKIIAAAAHSNKSLEDSERNYLDLFIKNSFLPSNKAVEARLIFEKGIEIRDLGLHPDSTFVVKKYFLEMAIVTIWSDKVIEDSEMEFLQNFSSYLELSHKDLENSLFSIKELAPDKKLEWK